MDARMVGNVNGAAFWPAAGGSATAVRLHPALGIDRNICVPTYRGNHIDHEITAGRWQMEMGFIGIALSRTDCPCICSEADVRHGYGGGTQRS